jgi:hypothetical protein
MTAAKKGFATDASSFIADAGRRPNVEEPVKPARAARKAAPAPAADEPYPWIAANERVPKHFGLRMPEPEHEKLKWIGERIPGSMHDFALKAVTEAIAAKLKELGIES